MKSITVFIALTLSSILIFQNCGSTMESAAQRSTLPIVDNPLEDPPVVPEEPTTLLNVRWNSEPNRTHISVSEDGLIATKDDLDEVLSRSIYANFSQNQGVWFYEATIYRILSTTQRHRIGIASSDGRLPDGGTTAAASYGVDFDGSFSVSENGIYTNSPATTPLKMGDTIGVLFDLNSQQAQFFVNGTLVRTQTIIANKMYSPLFHSPNNSNGTVIANFGTLPFRYPPSVSFEPVDQNPRGTKQRLVWSATESAAQFITIDTDGVTITKDDGAGAGSAAAYANFFREQDRWYFETTVVTIISSNRQRVGIASTVGRVPLNGDTGTATYGYDFNGSVSKHENGAYNNNPGGVSLRQGDVIGVAVDQIGLMVHFYVNGVLQQSSIIQSGFRYSPLFMGSGNSNATIKANFGSEPFAYAAPLGFKAAEQL